MADYSWIRDNPISATVYDFEKGRNTKIYLSEQDRAVYRDIDAFPFVMEVAVSYRIPFDEDDDYTKNGKRGFARYSMALENKDDMTLRKQCENLIDAVDEQWTERAKDINANLERAIETENAQSDMPLRDGTGFERKPSKREGGRCSGVLARRYARESERGTSNATRGGHHRHHGKGRRSRH